MEKGKLEEGRTPETLRLWLLGGFRVSVGSRSIGEQEWHLRKAASLLKLLTLAEGHRLHREQAMELLWPELDPEAALNNLHHALHVARHIFEPSAPARTACRYLHLRGELLALCPDSPLWIDVEAFEEAAATARHAREPAAFRAAIDLYSGELLPEERYEPWAEERRAQLRGVYLSLLLELAGLYEERKEEFEEAIEASERVVAEEPTHEEAHVGLMRLYARLGRRRKALRQYERLRETLFREFGEEPEAEATRLQQEIWAGTFPPTQEAAPVSLPPEEEPPGGAAGRHNLPLARTSFVGREREVLQVKRLLAMTRLLTLTGAGGSGKTRLALKVAGELARAYSDGAWLVELAPLSDGGLVPQAVASALGVREQPGRPLVQTLKDALCSRKMLLVVDNCEHLIEAVVGLVDALLDSCPGLRVLAASRETLNAAGEVTWVVPSLSVPDPRQEEAPTPQELKGYESVRLFVERARLRDPAFVLTPRNVAAVAEVCRRLDGIPLAIELAAARMGVLSAGQIAERLDDSLGLLSAGGRTADPRHQTLRGTLEWSFELLSEPERELFGRLSVFAGGFTLEAVEAVGAGEGTEGGDVLGLLGRLVDKSLVVAEAEAEGALRYRMLEPVRQYALERLVEGAEAEETRRRHAAFFVALAEEARPKLRAQPQVEWLQRLEKENGNLRGALSWALSADDIATAARLGWALYMFWWIRNRQPEGQRWMEPVLLRRNELPPWLRIRAIIVFGAMVYGQDYSEVLDRYAEELMELSREAGRDALAEAYAHMSFGLLATHRGDFEAAKEYLEEALPLFREVGEDGMATQTHIWLGTVLLLKGDHEGARQRFEEGLTLGRSLGDRLSICIALFNLAQLALAGGGYDAASRWFAEGIAPSEELEDRGNVAHILEGLGIVAGARGEAERAARLLGATEALISAIGLRGHTYYRPYRSLYERVEAGARAKLGEAAFEAALEEGRAMPLEEAIKYALLEEEEQKPPTPVPVPEQQPPPADELAERLTRREREVAVLLARGLTNRQIALELLISEHTVANHVAKILKKLKLRSRAQISSLAL